VTHITIDITDSGATLTQSSGQQPAAESGTNLSSAPGDLVARALSANNGGPAPSFEALPSAAAPLPFTSSGMPSQPGMGSVSAGAAPESLLGSSKP